MATLTDLDADVVGVGFLASRKGKENILRLQVSMDDPFAVQDLHGTSNLLEKEPDRVLTEGPHTWGREAAAKGKR